MNRDYIKFFFPKLFRRIASLRKLFWPYCNMESVAMRGYSSCLDTVSFKTRLGSMLGEFAPTLLLGISEEDKTVIVGAAVQALRHEFDLLGSGVLKSDPIEWQADIKCGKKWVKQFYTRIPRLPDADIKAPWELSRCQHLLWLGEAFMLTNDERYAREIVDEINWWIDDNPLMYTVNWTCAMDVAFRAVNWLFALNMIAGYEGFNDAFAKKVMRSLWQHGFFIRNNLEKVMPESNNHYTSDLVGLLYIGALFDHTKKGRKWKQYANKELRAETLNQVLPSGVHYERTVSYHRLMAEMLSYPVYMMKRIGEPVSEDVLLRIKGMYEYVSNYTKPNGKTPLVGDNDDGRFVPFLKRDFRNHEYLNNPLSVENRFVAAGMQPLFCTKQKGTKCYSDAGVAIIRDGNNYLFINNGGYSKRPKESDSIIGTHSHNDLLSFELNLGGKDVIVDPGTYLYTSDSKSRNEFRSTKKHNTAVVDGEEQNDFLQTFYLKRNVLIGDLKHNDRCYEGCYRTIKGNMNHLRRFNLTDKGLIIEDKIQKEGNNHLVQLFFHFAQGISPTLKGKKVSFEGINAVMSFNTLPEKLDIFDDTLSPSYGVRIPSKSLEVAYIFDNEIHIQTIISN